MFKKLWGLFSHGRVATKCGHKTSLKGKIKAFGHAVHLTLPHNERGVPDYCLSCLSKMTIQCAHCGEPIFITDAVRIGSARKIGQIPPRAVKYEKEPGKFVRCARWKCSQHQAIRDAFWVAGENGEGRVKIVPTLQLLAPNHDDLSAHVSTSQPIEMRETERQLNLPLP